MSWTAPERIESPYSSALHRERDDAAQGARDMMITDCFGTRESMDPGIYVRIRYPQQEKDKGYIDCGWGRLLEYNRRHEHIKLGMNLLGRKPVDE